MNVLWGSQWCSGKHVNIVSLTLGFIFVLMHVRHYSFLPWPKNMLQSLYKGLQLVCVLWKCTALQHIGNLSRVYPTLTQQQPGQAHPILRPWKGSSRFRKGMRVEQVLRGSFNFKKPTISRKHISFLLSLCSNNMYHVQILFFLILSLQFFILQTAILNSLRYV